ncbi:MAG TPA: hypothetical protein VIX63_13335 [Vicinamibacterales bacterium]
MGPVTAFARVEVLDYDAGSRSLLAKRASIGARVMITDGLCAIVNGSHQTRSIYAAYRNSADVALTYTARFPG